MKNIHNLMVKRLWHYLDSNPADISNVILDNVKLHIQEKILAKHGSIELMVVDDIYERRVN